MIVPITTEMILERKAKAGDEKDWQKVSALRNSYNTPFIDLIVNRDGLVFIKASDDKLLITFEIVGYVKDDVFSMEGCINLLFCDWIETSKEHIENAYQIIFGKKS